jgi:hypothetical protein
MAQSSIGQLFKALAPEKKEGDVTISYSQFSMWATCPWRWKLNYVDGRRTKSPGIYAVFGSSFHETLQWYLHVLFTKSIKEADNINLSELLMEQMMNNYMLEVYDSNGGVHFSNSQELQEFHSDGVAIIDWIKKRRSEYFSPRTHELVSIEMPIYIQAADSNEKVIMNGFLDLVFRDKITGRILIMDIKTSTSGWNEYAKKDKLKASQLILYKTYLSKQYGYDEESIDIKYFIVKRKLQEGSMYPQKRVQEFTPPSGKPTRKKLSMEIDAFIQAGFNEDGSYKTEGNFPAVAGEKNKNCKYCIFVKDEDACPKENRIKL